MNRHVGRFLGYTLGYLFVVALGRISDAVERQAAEERERVALWLELQPEPLPDLTARPRRSLCLCSHCQQSRATA